VVILSGGQRAFAPGPFVGIAADRLGSIFGVIMTAERARQILWSETISGSFPTMTENERSEVLKVLKNMPSGVGFRDVLVNIAQLL
jgi:hypothetical protein